MQNEFASDLSPRERRIARLSTEAENLRSHLSTADSLVYAVLKSALRQVEAELRSLLPMQRLG